MANPPRPSKRSHSNSKSTRSEGDRKNRPARTEGNRQDKPYRSKGDRQDKPYQGKPHHAGSRQQHKPRAATPPPPPHNETPPTIFKAIITTFTEDGDPCALPLERPLVGLYPRLLLDPKSAVKVNDEVTVEIVKQLDDITFLAKIIAEVAPGSRDELPAFIGIYKEVGGYAHVRPMHKELAAIDFSVHDKGGFTLADGDAVRAQPGVRPARGATPVTIVEHFGANSLGLESLVAIENHGIPQEFPQDVLDAAAKLPASLTKAEIAEREDLRKIPIVTIDGADARDFDDAVWAEPTKDGHHIIVAIADVAHYIAEGSALDQEAQDRGNSTYFPDRVIPMLPERISNDLCSLRPHEDRAVLAVHLYIDSEGNLTKHQFVRGIIHSHARLTYEQAQAAFDGESTDIDPMIIENTLKPLLAAYQVLLKQRKRRGAIDLDIPEPKLVMLEDGRVEKVENRARLATHQLIEECMILANVAAASALQEKGAPCLYRIHPSPSKEKLDTLKSVLQLHNLKFASGDNPHQQDYQKLVDKVRTHQASDLLMRIILQSQQQARYDQENIGHYGLALQRYAHFTSPIRRYADLIVHRSLIKTLKLPGAGALSAPNKKIENTGKHINITERRSQQAEWEARDRMIARLYQDQVGAEFDGLVMNVLKFGCFVSVQDGLIEGLLPARLMDDDYYRFDEKARVLKGQRTKQVYQPGTRVKVKLIEADRAAGRLTFALAKPKKAHSKKPKGRR